jgi:hypothetical protein
MGLKGIEIFFCHIAIKGQPGWMTPLKNETVNLTTCEKERLGDEIFNEVRSDGGSNARISGRGF